MFAGRYTPEQIIREMRKEGLDLYVGEDGVVHGRFRERGRKMTMELRALAEQLQGMNDAVAAILRAEHATEYTGIPVEQALALGERVRAGEAELVGKVTYHKGTGLCDLTVKGAADE